VTKEEVKNLQSNEFLRVHGFEPPMWRVQNASTNSSLNTAGIAPGIIHGTIQAAPVSHSMVYTCKTCNGEQVSRENDKNEWFCDECEAYCEVALAPRRREDSL
jgi:hypothetical protein